MGLSPRQQLSFNHLADLYRPGRTFATDNKSSAEGYTLAYSGVRCRFEINQSSDTTSALGRIENDNFLSLDNIHLASDQEVDDSWWVKNVSLNVDGTESSLYGRWWYVRGQPQKFVRSTRREGGKILVKASQEANAPLGIEV